MGKYINIKEVGPRDGFQNVKKYIPVETKLQMIEGIVKSGIKNVQITSFMNPKAVPQTSDAAQIAQVCLEKYPNTGKMCIRDRYHPGPQSEAHREASPWKRSGNGISPPESYPAVP